MTGTGESIRQSEVVKLFPRIWVLSVIICSIISSTFYKFSAQNNGWEQIEACAGLSSARPDAPFDGLLVMVDSDAARAFRDEIATTYVLSFAGGNFVSAGAVSPNGKHYAVPNGVITTVSSSDIRYTVQEIRIVTTETVPRIIERIPWRASFPFGTRFTSSGDIPPVQWLDDDTIQFVNGTISDGHTPVQIDVFVGGEMGIAKGYPALGASPDRTRVIAIDSGGLALVDTSDMSVIAALPPTPYDALQIAWSPDNTTFALTTIDDDAITLRLYSNDAVESETVVTLPPEQVLWNLRWSPDGSQLAFTAFDPQTNENRLHVADASAQTVTDTCLPLVADVSGKPFAALAWSPDSTQIAVLTGQTSAQPQIQIYSVSGRTRYTLIPVAGRLLGWYP
jgi:WD40 repeat protein